MEEQKVLTMEEIRKAFDESEVLFPTGRAMQLLEDLLSRYPGLDLNSPEGNLLARKTLTPLALQCILTTENARKLSQEKLLTTEDIQDALAAAEETFWPSVLDSAAGIMMSAAENLPTLDWDSPEGDLLFRRALTPLALTCLRNLREEKEKEEQSRHG